MKTNELKKLIKNFDTNIVYNADLKKKNWFNIGGKAKVFFKANELKDLIEFLKILDNKEKIHIIGAGSNTLIRDYGIKGVVVKLGSNFSKINFTLAKSVLSDSTLIPSAIISLIG